MSLLRAGNRRVMLGVSLVAIMSTGCPHAGSSVVQAPAVTTSTHADREFAEHVKKYVKLRKHLDASLRSLKTTKDSARIDEHQRALGATGFLPSQE